jgi:O-antigen/teichoic acid export membrane protein
LPFKWLNGPIARATLGTTSVLGVRLLAQVGTLLIVAHLLGAEDFGRFAGMAALAVTLGALATFGTHLLLLREVSCAPELPPKMLALALGTTSVSGSLLLLLYLLLTTLWLDSPHMHLSALLGIGLSDILLLPLLTIPAVIRQGQGQIVQAQWLLVLPQALRLLAALGVAFVQPDNALTAYTLAYAAAALISLPIGFALLPVSVPHWRQWHLPKRGQRRDASGFAALNLTALGPNELDKTLALHLLPIAAAGSYAAASRVLGPLVLPVLAMMISALPRLFREHGQTGQNRRLLNLALLLALGYGLLAAAALWLFAPLIAALFSSQYGLLADTLRWLALAVPGLSLRYVTSNALMSVNLPWLRVGVELSGLLILAFAAWLFAEHDATGMAWALACTEWGMVALGIWVINFYRQDLPKA